MWAASAASEQGQGAGQRGKGKAPHKKLKMSFLHLDILLPVFKLKRIAQASYLLTAHLYVIFIARIAPNGINGNDVGAHQLQQQHGNMASRKWPTEPEFANSVIRLTPY